MRTLFFTFILALTACKNISEINTPIDQTLHCPGFLTNNWHQSEINEVLKSSLISKQKFAVPENYSTLWFRSKQRSIGLCIIPNKRNRGSEFGCGSAYAIYDEKQGDWQVTDQKVTICGT
jgi:hypothetical protein